MGTNLKRTILTLTPDMEMDLDRLKQEKFYNVPYSAMIRHLVDLGIRVEKENGKGVRTNGNI